MQYSRLKTLILPACALVTAAAFPAIGGGKAHAGFQWTPPKAATRPASEMAVPVPSAVPESGPSSGPASVPISSPPPVSAESDIELPAQRAEIEAQPLPIVPPEALEEARISADIPAPAVAAETGPEIVSGAAQDVDEARALATPARPDYVPRYIRRQKPGGFKARRSDSVAVPVADPVAATVAVPAPAPVAAPEPVQAASAQPSLPEPADPVTLVPESAAVVQPFSSRQTISSQAQAPAPLYPHPQPVPALSPIDPPAPARMPDVVESRPPDVGAFKVAAAAVPLVIDPYPLSKSVAPGRGMPVLGLTPHEKSILSSGAEAGRGGSDGVGVRPPVAGFANNVPLSLAVTQLVPESYGYVFASGVDADVLVSWQGGAPWDSVLRTMLRAENYQAHIDGRSVTIHAAGHSPLPENRAETYPAVATLSQAPALIPVQTHAQDQGQDYAQAQTQTKVQPSGGQPGGTVDMAARRTWQAPKGASLRDVLVGWCAQAGAELHWSSQYDYPLQSPVRFNGTFQEAVQNLLSGLREAQPRPMGRLHPNLPDGPSVLVVETRHILK